MELDVTFSGVRLGEDTAALASGTESKGCGSDIGGGDCALKVTVDGGTWFSGCSGMPDSGFNRCDCVENNISKPAASLSS